MADQIITPVTSLDEEQTQPRLTIDPHVKAADGSEWIFNGAGYDKIVEPWAVESHIPPIKKTESFGDVESWAEYVRSYGEPGHDLLTWNERGLRAVLDYHSAGGLPNRCQWIAEHPFVQSSQWQAWTKFANGSTRWSQQQTVDMLDALAQDIVSPDAATVIGIIRTLRATVNTTAASELREDGSTSIEFTKNSAMKGQAVIPSEITIGIPVLKGHTVATDDGKLAPVLYRLPVKVRPSIDDTNGTISFRFLLPTAEQTLESAVADRVAAARAALGESRLLLRAAI